MRIARKRRPRSATEKMGSGRKAVSVLSSDDEDTIASVAKLAKRLGFAPVTLGKLSERGLLVLARGCVWGPLIFQDLFKKQQ
jgi:8-hydroxy-5-deazaflavin:NADPH oxidoreductase